MLSDDPDRLDVFQMALAQSGKKDWLLVDAAELPTVTYRAGLEGRQPMGWLTAANGHELKETEILGLLEEVARAHRVFYLHPGYGRIYEGFYAEPVGSIFELKLRGKDPLDVPALADGSRQVAEQFWTAKWDKELSVLVPPQSSSTMPARLAKYGLVPASRESDGLLAGWCSIPLDAWAVALQRGGHLHEAQTRLEQALLLNSNNVSSRITRACNTNLQAGARLGIQDISKLADRMGTVDRITNTLSNCGPVDEPTVDFLVGSMFYNHDLLIEAAEQLDRARVLAPGVVAPELDLAEIYNELRMPERCLPLVRHMREEMRNVMTNQAVDLNLAFLESNSWLMQTNREKALGALQSAMAKYPGDFQVQNRILHAYISLNDFTNALGIVNSQLADSPNDVARLDIKAALLMQTGRPSEALPVLDRILMMTNLPDALINRALAQISIQNFALAKVDLAALQKQGLETPLVDFGLALEAEHDLDTNSACRYFQLCLNNTPSNAPLWRKANAHLLALAPPATTR
jgi:tetratricopeptide (TPR) repeat protein